MLAFKVFVLLGIRGLMYIKLGMVCFVAASVQLLDFFFNFLGFYQIETGFDFDDPNRCNLFIFDTSTFLGLILFTML